jgi:hypothetical protein
MSDEGLLEALSSQVAELYQASDRSRLGIGAILAAAEKAYGAGVVNKVASHTGIKKATLYDYQRVHTFYDRPGMSAAQIIEDRPNLLYSHLRAALRYKDWEAAYDALVDASNEGLSADAFGVKIAKDLGKDVPILPLLDVEGEFYQVVSLAAKEMQKNPAKRARIVIKEAA